MTKKERLKWITRDTQKALEEIDQLVIILDHEIRRLKALSKTLLKYYKPVKSCPNLKI